MSSPGVRKKRVRQKNFEDVTLRCIKFRLGQNVKIPGFKSKDTLCVKKDGTLRAFMCDTRDVKEGKEHIRDVQISINLQLVTSAQVVEDSREKTTVYVVQLETEKDIRSGNKHLLGNLFFFYFETEEEAEEFVSTLHCHGVVPSDVSRTQSSEHASTPIAHPSCDDMVVETPTPPRPFKKQAREMSVSEEPAVLMKGQQIKQVAIRQTVSPSQMSLAGPSEEEALTASYDMPQAGQKRKSVSTGQVKNELSYNDLQTMDGEQLLLAFDDDPVIESLRLCLRKICDNVVENYIRIHVETKRKENENAAALMTRMSEALLTHGADVARLQEDTSERAQDILKNAKACDQGYVALLEPMQALLQKFSSMVTDVEARHDARQALPSPFPK